MLDLARDEERQHDGLAGLRESYVSGFTGTADMRPTLPRTRLDVIVRILIERLEIAILGARPLSLFGDLSQTVESLRRRPRKSLILKWRDVRVV
jgi:hypothetical protein